MRGQAGFGTLHRPGTRVLTWPNSNTHTTTISYDHEGENTLAGGGTTLVTAVHATATQMRVGLTAVLVCVGQRMDGSG